MQCWESLLTAEALAERIKNASGAGRWPTLELIVENLINYVSVLREKSEYKTHITGDRLAGVGYVLHLNLSLREG